MKLPTIIRRSRRGRRVLEPGSVPFFRFGKKGTDPRLVRTGHTLMELVAAMVCSAVLLAGLGSVMLIGRQVAYSPTSASVRTQTAKVVSHMADELQYATHLIGQSTKSLEFVIADRDGDGRAEKISYEWSGTSGDPLLKTVNGGDPHTILEAIEEFNASYVLKPETMTLNTTSDTAESVLFSNESVQAGVERDVSTTRHSAQLIDAAALSGVPANAICWNATKVHFQGRDNGSASETLLLQLRSTGGTYDGPTSEALGQVSIAESSLGSMSWKTNAKFNTPVRGLALHRKYALVWSGVGGNAARLLCTDSTPSGVFESDDGGATWNYMSARRLYYRLYGTYTLPGLSHNLTRNFVSHVQLTLQSGGQSHARIDTSVPLVNLPEQLSAYWRADFDRDPTTTDSDGDGTFDWAMAAGASFDSSNLIGGVWHAIGALETRPLNDFTKTTIVEVSCRNTNVGGNGAVVHISADRQSGLHGPIAVLVKLQADGTQTLTLLGKTSDLNPVTLFTYPRLSSDFVTFRLTIVPHLDLVNLHINDEDQGAYSYPVYAPSTSDRYLTLYANTSLAEFDYADVRVTEN